MRTRFIGDFALCRQWYGYALNRYRALGDSQSCILRPDIGVEIVLRKENDLVGEIRIKAQVKADYYSTQHLFIDITGTIDEILTCDLFVVLVDDKSKDGSVYEIRLPLITPSYRIADEILAATFDLANPKNVYFLTKDTEESESELHYKKLGIYTLYKTIIEKDEEGNLYLTEPQSMKEVTFTLHNRIDRKKDISFPDAYWDEELNDFVEFIRPWDAYYTIEEKKYSISVRDLYINGNIFKWLYEWDYKEVHEHIEDEDPTHTGWYLYIMLRPIGENRKAYWYSLLIRGTKERNHGYGYEDIDNFSCPQITWSISAETITLWDPNAGEYNVPYAEHFFSILDLLLPAKEVSPTCVLNKEDFLGAEANSDKYFFNWYLYSTTDLQIGEWYFELHSPYFDFDNIQPLPHSPFRFRVYTNDDQYQQIVGHSPPILFEIDLEHHQWEDFKRIPNWALCLYEHDYCVMIDYIVKSSEADLDFLHTLFVGYLQNKKAYLAAKKKAEETGDETKKKDAILRGVLVGYKSIFFVNATKQTTQAKDIQNDPIYHIDSGNTYRRVRMDLDEGTKDVSQIYPKPYIANILLVDKRNNIRRCNGKPPSIGGNNNGT